MSKIKVVMFGLGAVGKSAITIQFVHRRFSNISDLTIEDMFKTTINIGQQLFHLEIIDTAGPEGYNGLKDDYIRYSDGFIIVYSINEKETFDEITVIRNSIYRVLEKKKDEHIPICLVGNKCDLESERKIGKEVVEEIACSWNVLFFEASAKTNVNITELFEAIVKDVYKTNKPIITKPTCSLL